MLESLLGSIVGMFFLHFGRLVHELLHSLIFKVGIFMVFYSIINKPSYPLLEFNVPSVNLL